MIDQIKEYDSNLDGEEINARTVEPLTGNIEQNWHRISGLFASSLEEKFILHSDFSIKGTYPTFEISAYNKNIAYLEIKFDLLNQLVDDKYIKLKRPNEKTGKKIFKEHLDLATAAGFKKLICHAAGGRDDKRKIFNGYYTWARFGFTMTDESKRLFLLEIKKLGREEDTLQELMLTKTGRTFWYDNGWDWNGEFYLKKDSDNNEIWNRYYQED